MRETLSRRRIRCCGALLALALALLGCGPDPLGDRMTDYASQLREVLRLGPSEGPDAAPPRLPSRRHRHIEPPDHRINGFDFLAIQGCQLSHLVGQRNNSLGRVMVPSQRLLYELSVLDAADACIVTLGEERAAKLGGIIETKRDELPIHVWNAVWTSEEVERYLETSTDSLSGDVSSDDLEALERLAEIVERPVRVPDDGTALEGQLRVLHASYPLGALLRDVDRTRVALASVAEALEPRAPTGCRGDEVRLRTLFEQAYLPLQRELAALDRLVQDRLDAVGRIYAATAGPLATPMAAMDGHRDAEFDLRRAEGRWQRYRAAVVRHARAWEPTLRLCGVLPDPDAVPGPAS